MWRMAASHVSSFSLSREEVALGFQIAGFASPGFINLHLEKTCLLVEQRAENISFHKGNRATHPG